MVGVFPGEASILRLIGAVLLEQNDEWAIQHRSMQVEAMAELIPRTIDGEAALPRLPRPHPKPHGPRPPKPTPKSHQLDGCYPSPSSPASAKRMRRMLAVRGMMPSSQAVARRSASAAGCAPVESAAGP